MSKLPTSMGQSRGLERLFARETSVTDLIQFLSDCDPAPWASTEVGFVPQIVQREALRDNHADLKLSSPHESTPHEAVVEVKLWHTMNEKQRKGYEGLGPSVALYVAALDSDRASVMEGLDNRWQFLSLGDLIGRWGKGRRCEGDPNGDTDRQSADRSLAEGLAKAASEILQGWDREVSATCGELAEPRTHLSSLSNQGLARVVSRRVAKAVRKSDCETSHGVTSGGGWAVVEAWKDYGEDDGCARFLTAEVRWNESSAGELRFGVEAGRFREDGEPDDENEHVRRVAYDLARSLDVDLDATRLCEYIKEKSHDLASLVSGDGRGRPNARGDWEEVIQGGFPNGCTRRQIAPDFYGDGTLRHQARLWIDFGKASAVDVVDLLDISLEYLASKANALQTKALARVVAAPVLAVSPR